MSQRDVLRAALTLQATPPPGYSKSKQWPTVTTLERYHTALADFAPKQSAAQRRLTASRVAAP